MHWFHFRCAVLLFGNVVCGPGRSGLSEPHHHGIRRMFSNKFNRPESTLPRSYYLRGVIFAHCAHLHYPKVCDLYISPHHARIATIISLGGQGILPGKRVVSGSMHAVDRRRLKLQQCTAISPKWNFNAGWEHDHEACSEMSVTHEFPQRSANGRAFPFSGVSQPLLLHF